MHLLAEGMIYETAHPFQTGLQALRGRHHAMPLPRPQVDEERRVFTMREEGAEVINHEVRSQLFPVLVERLHEWLARSIPRWEVERDLGGPAVRRGI